MKGLKRGLLLGFSAIALAACGANSNGNRTADDSEAEGKQVLHWSEGSEIPTMDASMIEDQVSIDILANTNESLYRKTLTPGEFEPGIATGEPEISDDGKVYTFKLREDAKWSNGDPVTANDFVFAWRRLADPAQAAPMSFLMEGFIKNADEVMAGDLPKEDLGVKAVDDHTLEVTFENAYPYWKELLSMTVFTPLNQKFVEEKGDSYGTNSENTVYNGPFILDDWDGTGLSWKLVKNDGYWDKDAVQVDEVTYDVVKETNTAMNLFQAGQIDYAPLKGEYVQQVEGDPQLKEQSQAVLTHLNMNFTRDGEDTPLANEHIRRAIASAINRESMVRDVLKDSSIPAGYYVPEDMSQDEETGKDFRERNGNDMVTFDPEFAQEEFKKGLEELGQDSLELELLGYDTDTAKSALEFLQGQLQQNLPGLSIQITSVPFKNGLTKASAGDFDIMLRGYGADFGDPYNMLSIFAKNNPQNDGSYDSEKFTSLLAQAQQESDPSKRFDILAEAEKVVVADDVALAPLYQSSSSYLLSDRVKNVGMYPVGDHLQFKWASVEE